jgi:hypothetical protein
MGRDLTDKRLSEVFTNAGVDGVLAHFAALKTGRLIGFLESNVPRPGLEHRNFKVVELPLGDDRGDVVRLLHLFSMQRRRG